MIIVLVGESASGKSSVQDAFVKQGWNKLISYTTRPPREYEEDGVDYHFVTKSQFRRLEAQGFFVETAVYNGWYYGSAKKDYKSKTIAVLTPHGLRQLKKINKDEIDDIIFSVYIDVPRRDRLIKILQRGDNIEEAYRRNLSDVGQFDGIKDEVDCVITNSNYQKTVQEIIDEIYNSPIVIQ